MKRVLKGREPLALTAYRLAMPIGKWDEMKSDAHNGGSQAYQDCRSDLVTQQKGLCAYCEIDIWDNDPLKCRVEHFHPKSDVSTQHNWALDWLNMLAVCNGGSNKHIVGGGYYLEPMSQNLSCDAHKDRMIQTKKLAEQCEGWILNPLQLAAFPVLFRLEKSTGRLLPDPVACAIYPEVSNNQHSTVYDLVQHTIDMLNLNCERLIAARLLVIRDIGNNIKKQRNAGFSLQQGMNNLVQQYFRSQWKAFFTTIRLCLGQPAEVYLQSINFQG
jgi:uncharacterized protein (TIGR02646 family)